MYKLKYKLLAFNYLIEKFQKLIFYFTFIKKLFNLIDILFYFYFYRKLFVGGLSWETTDSEYYFAF